MGRLSEESKFTLEEEPVRPVTDDGILLPPSMPPDMTLRLELTADVRVPMRLELDEPREGCVNC